MTSRFVGKSSNLDFTPPRRYEYRASLSTPIEPNRISKFSRDTMHPHLHTEEVQKSTPTPHPRYLGAGTNAYQIAPTSLPHSTNATRAASFGKSPAIALKQNTKSTCACAHNDSSGLRRIERWPRRRGRRFRRCGRNLMRINEELASWQTI